MFAFINVALKYFIINPCFAATHWLIRISILLWGATVHPDSFGGNTPGLFKIPVAAMEKGQSSWDSYAFPSKPYWGVVQFLLYTDSRLTVTHWTKAMNGWMKSHSFTTVALLHMWLPGLQTQTYSHPTHTHTHKIHSRHTNTHTMHTKQKQQMWVEAADSGLDQQSPSPLRLDVITACH